jgi:hypothetical protein
MHTREKNYGVDFIRKGEFPSSPVGQSGNLSVEVEPVAAAAPRNSAPPLPCEGGSTDRLKRRAKGEQTNSPERNVGEVIHAIGLEAESQFRVTLDTIYQETKHYLERLGRAASEGRAVTEANNFLRWLYFSGVLSLLGKNYFINEKFLTLRKDAENLQEVCKPFLQDKFIKPPPSQARIDELNDKVDLILSSMARNVTPLPHGNEVLQIGGAS